MFRFLSPDHAALLPACDQPQPRLLPPSFTRYNGRTILYNKGSTRSYHSGNGEHKVLLGHPEPYISHQHFVKTITIDSKGYCIALTDKGELYHQYLHHPFTLYEIEQLVDIQRSAGGIIALTATGKIYTPDVLDYFQLILLEIPATISKIHCGKTDDRYITTEGEVYAWNGDLVRGVTRLSLPLSRGENVLSFVTGGRCSLFLTDRGRVYVRALLHDRNSFGFILECTEHILSVTLCDDNYLFAVTVTGKLYSTPVIIPGEDDSNVCGGVEQFTHSNIPACVMKILSAVNGRCTVFTSCGNIYDVDAASRVVTRVKVRRRDLTYRIIRSVASYYTSPIHPKLTLMLTGSGDMYMRNDEGPTPLLQQWGISNAKVTGFILTRNNQRIFWRCSDRDGVTVKTTTVTKPKRVP